MNRRRMATTALDSQAIFIDDVRARPECTDAWVREFNATGLDTAAMPRIRLSAERRRRGAIGRAARRTSPKVVIGRGTGADEAYQLLVRGAARAAVLIASNIAAVADGREHGPLLLLDASAAPESAAAELRTTGICDQQTVDDRGDPLTQRECGPDLAQYIRDWLDFHQLITH